MYCLFICSMPNKNYTGYQKQRWQSIYRKGRSWRMQNWLPSCSSNKFKYNPSWLSLEVVKCLRLFNSLCKTMWCFQSKGVPFSQKVSAAVKRNKDKNEIGIILWPWAFWVRLETLQRGIKWWMAATHAAWILCQIKGLCSPILLPVKRFKS